jgi:hypothetical protein
MPTVLSVTLGVAAQQLAKHKAIVTLITAIEELAGVTMCSHHEQAYDSWADDLTCRYAHVSS